MGFKERYYSPLHTFLLHGRILKDSEIACYASHFSLWQKCVELNEPIIVLEDDIEFESHFYAALGEIVDSRLPFVRFYYRDKKRSKYVYQINNTPFYHTLRNTNGTQGYYLTPSAARAFMAVQIWDSPVDIAMEFVSRHKVDNIIYHPFLVRESEFSQNSTIQNSQNISQNATQNLTNTTNTDDKLRREFKILSIHRIFKPFYRNAIYLKRAIFKLFYKPPKL